MLTRLGTPGRVAFAIMVARAVASTRRRAVLRDLSDTDPKVPRPESALSPRGVGAPRKPRVSAVSRAMSAATLSDSPRRSVVVGRFAGGCFGVAAPDDEEGGADCSSAVLTLDLAQIEGLLSGGV